MQAAVSDLDFRVTGVERRLDSLEDDVRRSTETLNDHLILTAPLIEQQVTIKATVETLHGLVIGKSGDGIVSSVRDLKREVEASRSDIHENLAAIRHLTRLIVGDGTKEYPGMMVSAAIKKANNETVKKIGWYVLSFITGGIATAAALTQFLDWLGK